MMDFLISGRYTRLDSEDPLTTKLVETLLDYGIIDFAFSSGEHKLFVSPITTTPGALLTATTANSIMEVVMAAKSS